MVPRLLIPRTVSAALLYFGLSCLFLWRVVFAGEVFLPAGLLRYFAPWTAPESERPPWNPLFYDSIGQFHPWRVFAGDSVRAGAIPLWNPYQFCGTPFLANSQSAVLYPGTLLYYLMPADIAAGWTVVAHLTLAGLFTWMLLRALGCRADSAALGGVVFAFSSWQISWLHLPTFLASSCWLPLVLLMTLRIFQAATFRSAAGLGLALGMSLLGGHLQIAFYIFLSAVLFAFWQTVRRARDRQPILDPALKWVGGILLAAMFAAPQLLPALELSRFSHRAGPPSEAGYQAYVGYAAPAGALSTLFLPDMYGNPSRPDAPYFGTSRAGAYYNYAEGALYVGLFPLLLGIIAISGKRRGNAGFFLFLAALALLLGLGTPLNRLLYFLMPGFGSSGSPGRVFVLWAFSAAALAALGWERVRSNESSPRHCFAAMTAVLLAGIVAAALSVSAIRHLPGMEPYAPAGIERAIGFMVLGTVLLWAGSTGRLHGAWAARLAVGLCFLDLVAIGIHYNQTARRADVYPVTEEISRLREQSQHARIAPINRGWSFMGPQAVLPPNGATVFRLRDVQGYDSLFPGRYKRYLAETLGVDPSPPEVGNMVFLKRADPKLLESLAAEVVVQRGADGGAVIARALAPAARVITNPEAETTWIRDEPARVALRVESRSGTTLLLKDPYYPGWRAYVDGSPVQVRIAEAIFREVSVPPGRHVVELRFEPGAFRAGLFLMLLAAAVCASVMVPAKLQPARTAPDPGLLFSPGDGPLNVEHV